jgi:benzoate membrane transport protein
MLNQHTLGNGGVGFLFAATGPMAIILAKAARGHLSDADIASWVAVGYGLPAFLTLGFSLSCHQPIPFAWSIAAVPCSARRSSGSFAECIGAYLTAGALIAVQAATGLGKRAMDLIPITLFMAMVAAMFLLWHRLLRPGPDVTSSQGRPRSGWAEADPRKRPEGP